jgi:hypothetical protein
MSSKPGNEPTQVNADALDLQGLIPLLAKLADAAERLTLRPPPWDPIPIRMAVYRAAWEFKRIIPTTDWKGMGPCPVIIGRRTGAIHAIFEVLRDCLGWPMPPWAWIAAELRAVLAELQPESHDAAPEDQYVTRDQIAALVNRHPDTVADWFNSDGAPEPDVVGGGGKRHEYLWSKVRPWLEEKSGRTLPKRFPSPLPPG